MNNFELRSKKLQESQDALEQKILRQRNFIINKFCKESYGKEAEGGGMKFFIKSSLMMKRRN